MENYKKIALFTYALDFGGTEKVVSLLVNELSKYFDVTLILMYSNIDFHVDKSVNIITLSHHGDNYKTRLTHKLFDYFKFIYKYNKVLKSEGIEVSISFLAFPNIINGIAKMRNKNIRTIISERCFPSIMYKSNFGITTRKILFSLFYNKNDKLFSNSIYINQDLIDNFSLKIDSHVVYNPIVAKDSKPPFVSYKNNGEFNIITVGRLITVKNQKGIINAIATLPSCFSLDIYGNGALKESLSSLIDNLDIDNRIRLNESVSDIKLKLIDKHCFVLNSLTEGFPNALLEAMSLGVPVISSNCMSGPLELLNDNNPIEIEKGSFVEAKYGILININDDLALAKAVQYLQENESIRKQYSQLSYERAKAYDIKVIGSQVKELINSL